MPNTLYSFDVFDTCITRPYLVPTDLFRDLARQTLLEAGLDVSKAQIDQLQQLRIDAERESRTAHAAQEDISLDQIYQCLTDMVEIAIDPEFMKSAEIALELESCSPISSVLEAVTDARRRGKIVYISDMYLSSTVIREMLSRCGFWRDGDALYVSNEVGKSKHHCSLFHHVAITEGVRPQDIRHLGDNKRADVRMARATGVKASLYTAGQLTSYEKDVTSRFRHASVRDFIGINRCARLCAAHTTGSHPLPPASAVHSVIAPFLVVYVSWVLQQARADGRKRLYFVSRDAEIFYKIARILSADDDSIECRYLYGSRKAWFAPSLQHGSKEEMKWAYESIMARTPRAILRRLDLAPEEFLQTLSQHGFRDIDEELSNSRTSELVSVLESHELKDAVLQQAEVNRKKVLGYVEQEGLLDGTPWSLVDIGWVLNCQTALRRILTSRAPDIDVHGYYLGVAENHAPETSTGGHRSYFAHSSAESPAEYYEDGVFHLPSVVVLEHLFTPATHGTVIGYQSRTTWEPVTRAVEANGEHQLWVKNLHEMVENHALALARSSLLDDHLAELMPAANHLLFNFLRNPEEADASAVGWLNTNIEQSHYKEYDRTLASPLSLRDLLGIVRYELTPGSARYAHPGHVWLDGSAALSKPVVRFSFKILRYMKRIKGLLK